jgi:hypothetical protein
MSRMLNNRQEYKTGHTKERALNGGVRNEKNKEVIMVDVLSMKI